MDAIRVTKVGGVPCTKSGVTLTGTVHLTAHHLIVSYDDEKQEEMWVPYPLISLVSRLPQTLQGHYPITFHTRTFETFSLALKREDVLDVFESVKELTVASSVTQLYAFFYAPNPPYPTADGWSIYSPREEFGRMGLGSRTKAWRFTDINKDYSFCPTYPARMVIPTKISDTTLQYASKYRSKCRIPVLAYLHWANFGSITRSSQPMVGLTQNRSIQDEKLIEAIFQSHHSPELRASNAPVYGATSTNLIIDARPTANAMANTAKGAGSENMDHYKEGRKAYLGIDHIHAMRESLAKVVETLREADTLLPSVTEDLSDQTLELAVLDRQALRRSGWLRHISTLLEGTVLITKNIHINSSHVLIHCSDGWDRTSQLSALSQLCLDPHYRTIRGFEILIEKDWLSYGHKFLDRCGHLSSDKFFVSPNETSSGSGGGADAAQAFLASVQNRFVPQHHIKETSPVFHQFLESVRQIQRQFPERFEFNERFLHQLYYHLYSCQFGTFLYNCERERRVGDGGPPPCEKTISVWDYFNSPSEMQKNVNPDFDPSLDDPNNRVPRADMGVLLPNPKDVRFWHELYGRGDEEMNGKTTIPQVQGAEVVGPIDTLEEDPVVPKTELSSDALLPPSPSKPPLGLPLPLPARSRSASPGIGNVPREQVISGLDTTRPQTHRADSITSSFTSPSSTFPLRAPSSPSLRDVSPSSPGLTRLKSPEFLASGGVRSMWGKLSSNASAALSVMQEAYVGVAKDLRNVGAGDGDSEKTAELRGRDNLSTWGEDSSAGASSSHPASSNPWGISADTLDNPWGSVRSPSAAQRSTSPADFDTSLPADPTIAHPETTPRINKLKTSQTPPQPSLFGQTGAPKSTLGQETRRPVTHSPPPKVPSPKDHSADPLGVGLL